MEHCSQWNRMETLESSNNDVENEASSIQLPRLNFSTNKSPSSNPITTAEHYWERRISNKWSKVQKAVLAEQFFQHVWNRDGKHAALEQIRNTQQQDKLAKSYFDYGCQLWGEGRYSSALRKLEQSLTIHEACKTTSSPSFSFVEQEVRLHYALGTVHMGLEQHPKALKEFRRAWRIGGLQLGVFHKLTQASQHMVEIVLKSYMGLGILPAHCQLHQLRTSILREREGDVLAYLGKFESAMQEYRHSLIPEDHVDDDYDLLAQASIRCKMASLWEKQEKYGLAGDEWASALSLYRDAVGSDHPETIRTMERLTDNHRRIHRSLFCSSDLLLPP